MTEDAHDDPHPDDAEAERLHGRDAPALVHPTDLRPPTGWWQERGSSRTTPEGFTETTILRVPDPAVAVAAAVEARAALIANPRREPPKTIVGQAIAFLTMHGLPLPQEVVEALATAMSLNRRVPERSFADVAEAIEAARQAVAVLPVPRRARAVVLQVARWFAERGDVLPDAVFDAVIVALGLSDGRGALRQKVRESVAPSPKPEVRLTGVDWDGEGPMVVWRERPADPRVGMRLPELYLKAVEIEATARAARGRPGEQALSHQKIADEISTDYLTVRDWASTGRWQTDCYSQAYWKLHRPS